MIMTATRLARCLDSTVYYARADINVIIATHTLESGDLADLATGMNGYAVTYYYVGGYFYTLVFNLLD